MDTKSNESFGTWHAVRAAHQRWIARVKESARASLPSFADAIARRKLQTPPRSK
jgi:hypothetical protein